MGRNQCNKYRSISVFSFPEKVYANPLKKVATKVLNLRLSWKIPNEVFVLDVRRSTADQLFTLLQMFEKSWKYAEDIYICFVDLEKSYDGDPRDKMCRVLREYGVVGCLLMAVNSRYSCSKVCPFRRHIHILVKQVQYYSTWTLSIRGHKTSVCNHRKSYRFKPIFVPIFTYGHEYCVMTERVLSQVQEAKMGFLGRVHVVTLRDKVRNCKIRTALNMATSPPNREILATMVKPRD